MTGLGLGLWTAINLAVAGPATSPAYLPLHVAQAEGYFAKEQLDVSVTLERSEAEAAQALARGRADLAATSLDAAYARGLVEGDPPLILFGLVAAAPVAILISPQHKDTLRTVADLRGQIVGLPGAGTPEHAMLTSVLAHAGLKVHQVPFQSFGDRRLVGALEEGKVAAAVMSDPWVTRLVEDGTAAILADLRKRLEARRWFGVDTVYSAVFVRAGSKLSERELVALARALLRATARLQEAQPEALAALLPRAVTGNPQDFALRLLGAREAWLPRGRVTEEMLQASVAQARIRAPLPAALRTPHLRWYPLILAAPLRKAQETAPAR